MHNKVYPLKFQPIYQPKVWGGRRIETLGRTLPADENIGESWEIADLPALASTTGGGKNGDTGGARSVITNGPLAGKTLHDAIDEFGDALLGRLELTDAGGFPLLVKYLDAREHLSVQVHPSPAYAREHPESHLKSEAWYVVDAKPGAVIYKGVKEDVTPAAFRAALEANDEQAVTDMLIAVPVKAGDCHYLPSGTCHALGAGILVAEAQTPSDTTFRVFDWGRTDRELHIEQAMQCIHFGPPNVAAYEKRSHIAGMFTTVSALVSCEHFKIEKVRMLESYEQEIPYDQPAVWMVLQGRGRIFPAGDAEPVPFERGETMLVPANMSDGKVLLEEDTVWLEITFPKARGPLIA